MTLAEITEYINYRINDMNSYIKNNPYCDNPIDTINNTESQCFGVVDFAIKNGYVEYTEINDEWWRYLDYFRNRRNEVRNELRQKKRND